MEKLKKRWGITSNFQIIMIIVVFAITGSSSAYLAKPVLSWIGITKDTMPLYYYIPLYIILIFPIYQVLLVFFGFIFGQFRFFWNFEKRMLKMMGFGFLFKD